MITVRPASERGHGRHGWLDTYHTFSFNDYHDPAHMGFRALRVINEDWVAAGQGFGMHGHRDMEILTYVLEGALAHKDSLGNGAPLHPGEVQVMTAGTGIRHSEFNPSNSEPVHLYQIWIMPDRAGHSPSYDQRPFPEEGRRGRLQTIASPDGRDGSLVIHQNATVYVSALPETGGKIEHPMAPGRHAWLQVLRGSVELGGHSLSAGAGAAVSDESALSIVATAPAELMLFDLP